MSQPIIMIGPGTGVAPFRGFLQEREALRQQGEQLGPALLFFGCRKRKHDFIYQAELEGFAKNGDCQLFTAFSHDEGSEFVFVQHQMWQNRQIIWRYLEQGAMIYVCGDGMYMAPEVRATFKRIFLDAKTTSKEAEAEQWVCQLEDQHRYVSDVFGQKKN